MKGLKNMIPTNDWSGRAYTSISEELKINNNKNTCIDKMEETLFT